MLDQTTKPINGAYICPPQRLFYDRRSDAPLSDFGLKKILDFCIPAYNIRIHVFDGLGDKLPQLVTETDWINRALLARVTKPFVWPCCCVLGHTRFLTRSGSGILQRLCDKTQPFSATQTPLSM